MKDLHLRIIAGIFTACICSASFAATVVEQKYMGKKQTITINKDHAHIKEDGSNDYKLLDFNKRKAYMVDAKKKRIVEMDFTGTPPKLPYAPQRQHRRPKVKAELVNKGSGPKIAGYSTTKHLVKANGQLCSENYFSKKAAQVPYLEKFNKARSDITNSRKIKEIPVHLCQKAHDDLQAKSKTWGFPMKTVIKTGKSGDDKIMFEITSIKKDVKASADLFKPPAKGYKVISEKEMIAEEQAKMRKQMEKYRQRRGEDYRHMNPPRY